MESHISLSCAGIPRAFWLGTWINKHAKPFRRVTYIHEASVELDALALSNLIFAKMI